MKTRIPVIEASGTHREVGRQIGESARELIARGLAAYEERFSLLAGFSFADALAQSRAYLAAAEAYVPHSVDQLRGLAEGAGVAFDRVFAVNCAEEFTCRADWVWPAPEHCTSFAFATEGRTIAGHNEDWYPEDIEGLVLRHVRLAGGQAYLSVGAAWDLPMTGLSSSGFSSAANTVYFRDERAGVPNNCLLTAVLESPDIFAAADLIDAAPRARGSNHLLADAGGRILDVETSATRIARIDGGTRFAHANHYVAPELAAHDATLSDGTYLRRSRADKLIGEGLVAGDDPLSLGKSILRDHEGWPDLSICSHWNDADPAQDQSVTTASMVWEPAERTLHMAAGPPCEHEFETYSL